MDTHGLRSQVSASVLERGNDWGNHPLFFPDFSLIQDKSLKIIPDNAKNGLLVLSWISIEIEKPHLSLGQVQPTLTYLIHQCQFRNFRSNYNSGYVKCFLKEFKWVTCRSALFVPADKWLFGKANAIQNTSFLPGSHVHSHVSLKESLNVYNYCTRSTVTQTHSSD